MADRYIFFPFRFGAQGVALTDDPNRHLRDMVEAVLFTNLPQVRVLLHRVLQDRVTNLFGRLIFVLTDHLFDLQPVLFVAAVINPI